MVSPTWVCFTRGFKGSAFYREENISQKTCLDLILSQISQGTQIGKTELQ